MHGDSNMCQLQICAFNTEIAVRKEQVYCDMSLQYLALRPKVEGDSAVSWAKLLSFQQEQIPWPGGAGIRVAIAPALSSSRFPPGGASVSQLI